MTALSYAILYPILFLFIHCHLLEYSYVYWVVIVGSLLSSSLHCFYSIFILCSSILQVYISYMLCIFWKFLGHIMYSGPFIGSVFLLYYISLYCFFYIYIFFVLCHLFFLVYKCGAQCRAVMPFPVRGGSFWPLLIIIGCGGAPVVWPCALITSGWRWGYSAHPEVL